MVILGFIGSKLSRSLEEKQFRNFFGDYVSENNKFKIVYGMIEQSESIKNLEEQGKGFRKTFHDDHIFQVRTTSKVVTEDVIRSFAHIYQAIAKFVKKPIPICTDMEAIKDLKSTYITIGGPAVNEMTDWALEGKPSEHFEFSRIGELGEWGLKIISTGEFFKHPVGHETDYGLILKVRNSRFPDHFFFICAGIGSWGTSGAAWYLSNHWKTLYKEYKAKEFGIVVEVKRKSDSSATRIFPKQGQVSFFDHFS